jgi:transposase, IS30 family
MAYFTEVQRYQIEHDIRAGFTNGRIAVLLGVSESKVEREIRRCGRRADYCAKMAQAHRDRCAATSARNHPTIAPEDWALVEKDIQRKRSPAQAVAEHGLAVSLSGIYRRLKREQNKRLLPHLRHYAASHKRGGQRSGMAWVKRAKSIHERPEEVKTRDRIGHAECDSIVGKRNEPHKIVVLIDRALRYVRLGWVSDGSAAGVAQHVRRWLNESPHLPLLTLTTDQGYEFSDLPELLPDRLYACDPGKPYQKGQVENVNKLIRQYIPKGVSLRKITQAYLDWVANEINLRPRKRLSWKSPAKLLTELTAAPSS